MVRGSGSRTAVRRRRVVRCGPVGSLARTAAAGYPGSAMVPGVRARSRCANAVDLGHVRAGPSSRRPDREWHAGRGYPGRRRAVAGVSRLRDAAPPDAPAERSDRSRARSSTGMIVMSLALVAPLVFVAVGTTRLARLIASLRPASPTIGPPSSGSPPRARRCRWCVRRALRRPAQHPGRCSIGSFGVVVLREAPSPSMTRVTGRPGRPGPARAGSRSRIRWSEPRETPSACVTGCPVTIGTTWSRPMRSSSRDMARTWHGPRPARSSPPMNCRPSSLPCRRSGA